MTTAVLEFGATLVFVGFAVLVVLWLLGRPAHFVLGVLPIALLLFTQTIIVAVRQLLLGFQQIADTSTSSHDQIAAMCLGVVRPLWMASGIFLVALVSAALLQGLMRRTPGRDPLLSDSASSIGGRWGGWVLIVSSLLLLPVGFLIYRTARLARVIMLMNDSPRAAQDVIERAFAGPGGSIGDAIGRQIEFLTASSATLSDVLVVVAIVNILAIGFRKAPASLLLARYSWCVFGTACLAGAWSLLQLGADIRWFTPAIR